MFRKSKDKIMEVFHMLIGAFNILLIILIFLFIFKNSLEFFEKVPLKDFLFGREWISLSDKFGIIPLLTGTFWVTVIALGISVTVGIVTSIYISEYANKKMKKFLKLIIETMSAVPSVVLGYIGLYVLSVKVKEIFGLTTGLNAITGGIMLSFIAMPTIVSLTCDALNSIDKSYKEASLALGANKLETTVKVLVPAAMPGIFASIMLGFGRVVGETIAVLMITGNAPIIALKPTVSVRTLTATIASEMGEVVQGSIHYHALFAIALILFIISFAVNTIADRYVKKATKMAVKK